MGQIHHANICARCWDERNPSREPYRLAQPELEICCYCGTENTDGIYCQGDASELVCQHSN